jgi:hypothetical protein
MKTVKVGDTVEVINAKGALPMMEKQGFKNGAQFKVRSIGSKDFERDGGGIRLEGIYLWSDLTEYEQCFKRERFKKIVM